MDGILAVILALLVGFFLGASVMSDNWKDAAKRGTFEIGHVVYVAKPLRSTAPGTVCALDVPSIPKCLDGTAK
jgi:hypothetical protein